MTHDTLIHLSQTERYLVDVDPRKNRLYLRVNHEERGLPDPVQFLETLHGVKQHLAHGFTMLMELCPKEAAPQRRAPLVVDDIMDVLRSTLIRDAIDLLFEGGVRKIANVCREQSIQQGFSELEHLQQDVRHRSFLSRNAAEAWLDRQDG